MEEKLLEFLARAKRATYAAGMAPVASSRPASVDLPYREADWFYIDTYLGGKRFIGEEAVWLVDHQPDRYPDRPVEKPIWGMNYYGWMLVDSIPNGFSPFLKEALAQISLDGPYRGPRKFTNGLFSYECVWEETPVRFHGEERILSENKNIYRLLFHGGSIL